MTSPQIPFQVMLQVDLTPLPSVPVVGIAAPTIDVMEGGLLRLEVRRARNLQGSCAVDWTITANGADVTGTLNGTVTLIDGEVARSFVVQTVNRSGINSPRQLTATLSNPFGCELDQTASSIDVPIRDRTAVLGTWWNLPRRSGRAWASGTAGLTGSAAIDPNAAVEQAVAFLDAGFGDSRGVNNVNVASWAGVIGGALGGPLVEAGTQFDWSYNTSFGLYFQRTPLSSGWLLWDMVLLPTNRATNLGDATIWTEISGGFRDLEYQAMGARIKAAFLAKGHNLNRFIGVPHVAMNSGGYYQVFEATRPAYKLAMERAIAQIRIGAAAPSLRFAHCPAWTPYLGNYADGMPSNVDAVGLDYYPDQTVVDAASLSDRLDSTAGSRAYGLTTSLLDAADRYNLPILVPRWAPRHEAGLGCPYADFAVNRFYTDFLQPNTARVICDCVSNLAILNASGYLDTQAGGAAAWGRASTAYKTRWSGLNAVIVYVPPAVSIAARATSVPEG